MTQILNHLKKYSISIHHLHVKEKDLCVEIKSTVLMLSITEMQKQHN